MANAALHAETLKTAFSSFNHQSGLLENSYRQLQEEVSAISNGLAISETERHRDLLENERLGNRLARMLEALPGAVVVIDGNGIIMEHNSKSSELLGAPLLGCAWSVIVQREFCRGESVDGELKRNDGRWFSLARRPIERESCEILLITDITESRGMSEMLLRHQRLSCIGEMTARLGHQFRTPLASALLYASKLDDPGLADRTKVTRNIANRLQELAGMIDDMLGYAAGAKDSGEVIVVAGLLQDVAEAIRPQLDSSAQLIVDVVDPDLVIEVNCTALKGALLNLVNNAIQACGIDPRIELGAVRSNNQICLTVTDNGDGISDEIRSRIFDPFFTTRPQGTGLGLAVVRSVAEVHHGEVLVDSGPAGTTFAVCLPAPAKESVQKDVCGNSLSENHHV